MRTSEKFTINLAFNDTLHGKQGCISCHGGNNVDDRKKAHEGMNVSPGDGTELCIDCHNEIGEKYKDSLHATGNGQKRGLDKLSGGDFFEQHPESAKFVWEDCASCHASCSDCHISRPNKVKGGLLDGHQIVTDPEKIMEESCYSCHGARNAGEFMGNVNGTTKPADIHYKKDMTCMNCHDTVNVHGSGEQETEMYELETLPKCVDCHENVNNGNSDIIAHNVHSDDTMTCQVCHSGPANNCSNCHTGKGTTKNEFKLMIGKNPNQNELQPEKYIVIRHVPTVRDSFEIFDIPELEGYDQVANWKMSPTHNVSKTTKQNHKCNNCHGNEDIFLTEDDLLPSDSKANKKLLVDEIPSKIDQ